MSAIIKKSRRSKSLAFISALAVAVSLVVPLLGGTASANHPGGSSLEVSPETAELNPGTQHTLTATLFQDDTVNVAPASTGQPVQIHFEVESGPGGTVITDDQTRGPTPRSYSSDVSRLSPDMACTIPATASSCTVTFTSNLGGTNLVRAWINHSQTIATFDGDETEGRFSGGPTVPGRTYVTDCRDATDPTSANGDPSCSPTTAAPGAAPEPDITDVVSVTWIAPVAAQCIDAEPETDTNVAGTNHVIQAQVTNDATGMPGADQPNEFNCPGTAVSGATVRITRQTGPAVTIDGVATDTADKTTTSAGANEPNVSFTVRCVDPNCTGTNTFLLRVLGAPGTQADAGDTVQKTWAAPGEVATFEVFPERDTNEVGQTHTLTCRVRDAAEQGISNVNCDFQIESGPNENRVFVTGQPAGWIGHCFTDTTGMCSVSYSSTATGEDVIRGFNDRDGNNEWIGVGCPCPPGEESEVVRKTWVAVGFAPSQVRLDMGDTPPATNRAADCTVEDLSAFPNPVTTNHRVCAQARDQIGNVTAAPITFTIVSGPGFFTDSGTSTVNRGTTITIQHGAAPTGDARTFLRSTESGTTVVRACIEGTTICSGDGTKPWTAETPARNVTLTPESDTNPPGTNHELTATLLDRFGNPVPTQAVSWTRTGAGAVIVQENTTGADGTARLVIRSEVEGTTNVTVTITSQTECVKLAGNPAGAPAGNCTASATKTWETPPPPPPIDHDDVRTIGLQRFRGPRLRRRRVIVKGRVRVAAPNADHAECFANVPVRVQRRFLRGPGSRRFRTLRTITTGGAGVYRTRLFRPRRAHRIRVVARPLTVADHNCLRAVNSRRVRRR